MKQDEAGDHRPIVGLMLGDPTGIGPEVSVKLLASPAAREAARVVVVGDARVLELGMADASIRLEWRRVDSARSIDWDAPGVPVIDLGKLDPVKLVRARVDPEFCTFRVTSHMSLRSALDLITPERIEGAVRLAHHMLARMGKSPPRIGVAALNPHGGEGGMFGDEEITIIRPAVERLNAAGIACDGPVPSDTIFVKALAGRYDGVVMMYHDQGQIATKLIGFSKGITVTAGLPVVFATPAHGTAFDIVGQGKADPGGLEHALRAATRFAARSAQR